MNNISAPSLLEFGDFSIQTKKILYLWSRSDSIQCYIRGSCIPIIISEPDPPQLMKELHARYTFLIRVSDYLVNSRRLMYVWYRENGVQCFFDFPIPLTGRCEDDRLDKLCGDKLTPTKY